MESLDLQTYADTCESLIREARNKLRPPNKDYPLSIVLPEDIAWPLKRYLMSHISPWVNSNISDPSQDTLFGARFLTSKIIDSPIVF